ncbi:MAG: thiol oxidoreductase [Deltaproteobacteria bacterium]|nr:thiol oxidoreductase [Deltaproteobacteria bacterium]
MLGYFHQKHTLKRGQEIFLGLFLLFCFHLTACGGGIDKDLSNSFNVEEGEELSGGQTTVFVTSDKAFRLPAANLSFDEDGDFKIGNSFFEKDWVTAPATTTARDGLGPTFNARSCSGCHVRDGRGILPESPLESPVGLLFRLSIPGQDPETNGPLAHPDYGSQLQTNAILGVPIEGSVQITYEEISGQYGDGSPYTLIKPNYEFVDLSFGDLSESLFSPRLAPPMPGMGLLEAIAEEDVLTLHDPEDRDGDGISGKANYVWDSESQGLSLGRFGWKAEQASVRNQVAGAFLGDIGITSPVNPQNNCPDSQIECQSSPHGGEPEIEEDLFEKVVFYSSTVGVPARRSWDSQQVLAGKALFHEMGCTQCHRPSFSTRQDYPLAPLAGQKIRPYTDLLLHDMGEALSDHRPSFEAQGSEWRTPPLWGIGLNEVVTGLGKARFLHDGRARDLSEAILWHGGEGESAKENFRLASQEERTQLLEFLNSL